MKEKIIEMLHIQEALDKSFMEYKGLDKLDIRKVKCALRDELGEVNHEMKGDWCYWKKTQPAVDRNKVKEELADVWHFALTLHRLFSGMTWYENKISLVKKFLEKCKKIECEDGIVYWDDALEAMCVPGRNVLYECVCLTELLGFTFDEMYDAYIDKNKVNYERMKEGY